MELKVLKTNVKNCFYKQLRNKTYKQWSIEIYLALQENRGEGDERRERCDRMEGRLGERVI